MKWQNFIQRYFGAVLAGGIALGFFFPRVFAPFGNFTMYFLAAVITLTFLTIDYRSMAGNIRQVHKIGAALIISKLVLPFLLYSLARPLGESISIAVLLLSLTPFAGVSPTITAIVGGDTEFILLSHVLLTLLAPLYMPFLLLLYAGEVISIDVMQMVKSLLFLTLIPFGLSLIIKPLFRKTVERGKKYFGAVNILLISLLLTGLLANASDDIKSNPAAAIPMTGWVFVLGFILISAGWFVFFFLDRKKRLGLAVGNVYMNIALTAVIASSFFSSEVMMFILLYELPANILPSFLGRIKFFSTEKVEG